eukprot:TRINITY_DN857_c0_g1_i1.p1 TRINITY_DN857_c0_g1~~TRINITY_DN857_c0_g1_i1.p1  ORF type:complete len:512 (+),score=56.47 TRINITY_DN857_c0_g1_i1:562-2097(+)
MVLWILLLFIQGGLSSDLVALTDLYDSTNGINWFNHENWTIGDPCSNHWFGIECIYVGNRWLLSKVNLTQNNLTGTLKDSLCNFTISNNDISLFLSNNEISGPLPGCLLTAPNIAEINLSNNYLVGSIKAIDSTSLQHLDLSINSISGTLAMVLSRKLVTLNLSYNVLSGNLPTFNPSIMDFDSLDLSSNSFEGIISNTWFGLTSNNVSYIDISNNYLNGTIPSFGSLNLTYYDLSGNQFLCFNTLPPQSISFKNPLHCPDGSPNCLYLCNEILPPTGSPTSNPVPPSYSPTVPPTGCNGASCNNNTVVTNSSTIPDGTVLNGTDYIFTNNVNISNSSVAIGNATTTFNNSLNLNRGTLILLPGSVLILNGQLTFSNDSNLVLSNVTSDTQPLAAYTASLGGSLNVTLSEDLLNSNQKYIVLISSSNIEGKFDNVYLSNILPDCVTNVSNTNVEYRPTQVLLNLDVFRQSCTQQQPMDLIAIIVPCVVAPLVLIGIFVALRLAAKRHFAEP